VDRKAWPLDIRVSDLVTVAIVIAVIELNVAVGGGAGAAPLDALSSRPPRTGRGDGAAARTR